MMRKFWNILILSLLFSGCTLSDSESAIQGFWTYSSDHLANIAGEQHLTEDWFFDGGTFGYQVCCFNIDLQIGGSYKVIETKEDEITIELFQVRGSSSNYNGMQVRILVLDNGEHLNIGGGGLFSRLNP